uniref:Uncharacterized protein n=1 Tax=Fagus sylvatica TaxID=28930 RepID=A0A2N9GGW5_FAGSY
MSQGSTCHATLCRSRKHRYGKMGAVPVPGTSWVRIPPGYRCMRTPGVPDFGQKKKFPVRFGTGRVGSGTGRAKTPPFSVNLNLNIFSLTFLSHSISRRLVSAPDSLSSTLCLSLPPPPVSSVSALLCSLSLLSVCLCSALRVSLLSVNGRGSALLYFFLPQLRS